jgi:hypothetical protein
MDLTLNTTARKAAIDNAFILAMNKLKLNLECGKAETELYIDKDIAADVRQLIEVEINNKPICFVTVRTGINQYTGKHESFSGMLVGDNRYYKLRYHG